MLKLPQNPRALSRITFIIASVVGMLLLAGSPALAAGANPQPSRQQTSAAAAESQSEAKVAAGPSTGATSDTYAQRESGAKDLEQFSGGSAGIYIGGSTVAVVLLIVLIILIL